MQQHGISAGDFFKVLGADNDRFTLGDPDDHF